MIRRILVAVAVADPPAARSGVTGPDDLSGRPGIRSVLRMAKRRRWNMATRFDRLSASDLTNLAIEAPDTPMHVGALAVVDGMALTDADGRFPIAGLRSLIADRLQRAPQLRKVVYRPGPLAGRPLWIDDPAFTIDHHVDVVVVPPPGGEEELLRLTERLMAPLLDRSRPLWRLWFITGLASGHLAVLIKLHHAVADGLAAVRLIGALLDLPDPAEARAPPRAPALVPSWSVLVRDNLADKGAAVAGRVRRLTRRGALTRLARTVRAGWRSLARGWGAPRTSLNSPVGTHRRLAVVRLDLSAVKTVAHRYGATVNDVVLALIAGGLRRLLVTRGEPVDGLVLHAGMAVSMRRPGDAGSAGNRSGVVVVVRLPLGEGDPGVGCGRSTRKPEAPSATSSRPVRCI
jgi:diacylglycerol O-acyltransferase / wax synthase